MLIDIDIVKAPSSHVHDLFTEVRREFLLNNKRTGVREMIRA